MACQSPIVMGWMNYFGISHTYREVLELDAWMRRRVRLYYWTAPAAIAALEKPRSHLAWT